MPDVTQDLTKDFVIALSSQSESVITALFFANKRLADHISLLRRGSTTGDITIEPDQLDALEVEAKNIHRKLLALREVLQETFWLGFGYALRASEREDLFQSYPEAGRVVMLHQESPQASK